MNMNPSPKLISSSSGEKNSWEPERPWNKILPLLSGPSSSVKREMNPIQKNLSSSHESRYQPPSPIKSSHSSHTQPSTHSTRKKLSSFRNAGTLVNTIASLSQSATDAWCGITQMEPSPTEVDGFEDVVLESPPKLSAAGERPRETNRRDAIGVRQNRKLILKS